MEIIPTKYYSSLEVVRILGMKSRQYIAKYVNEGFLMAIQVGEGKHTRYSILGSWVIEFKKRQELGLNKKIGIKEIKSVIGIVLDYCQKNNIKTIQELKKKIK